VHQPVAQLSHWRGIQLSVVSSVVEGSVAAGSESQASCCMSTMVVFWAIATTHTTTTCYFYRRSFQLSVLPTR
jgi:hypothetical protein